MQYTPPDKFSPTSLMEFDSCACKWFYKRILNIEGAPTDMQHLLFGRVTHKVLFDFYDRIQVEDAIDNPYVHFSSILSKLCLENWDYDIPEKKFDDLKEICDKFAKIQARFFTSLAESGDITPFMPIAREFEIISDKFNVRCIVDRIDNLVHFSDYKTTKEFPELLLRDKNTLTAEELVEYNYARHDYVIQAIINAICIYDVYGEMPKYCTFIFVRHLDNEVHGGNLVIEISQADIDYVTSMINNATSMILSSQFPKANIPTTCNKYGGCEYKRYCSFDGICLSSF